jgi:hypothetical protein
MQRLDSPSLTPTSQYQGGAEGNGHAMTAGAGPTQIPVGDQPQPHEGTPSGGDMWKRTPSAGSQ